MDSVSRNSPAVDPNKICGALWYRKKTPAQRREVLRKYERNPAPKITQRAAGVLLIARSSYRALFVQRSNGEWECPGGRQELGEAFVHTAFRELAEETGFQGRCEVLASGPINEHYVLFIASTAREFLPRLTEHEAAVWAPLEAPPRPLRGQLSEVLSLVRTR